MSDIGVCDLLLGRRLMVRCASHRGHYTTRGVSRKAGGVLATRTPPAELTVFEADPRWSERIQRATLSEAGRTAIRTPPQ